MDYNSVSSSDFAQIIYILILIILLTIGLINQKITANKVIKYLLIWVLIASIAILAYSFRHNVSDIKDQVVTDLFPSKAVNKNNRQLTISISQDNHFYIILKIKNKDIKFMIDTGASEVIIDKKIAHEIGFDLKNLYYDKVFYTANGQVSGASILFEEIDISGIKFRNISASISSAELPIPLLGMSFLKKFKKYEFYRDKLVLTL